ncbi:lipopolysaccharide biosynthesis protein [Chryseobacterium nepalense]|uniref:lipopolysaccharide biosynthesis protein n=1 Tax=Chryseobacterium nepalense TaxID=1854498 RepID=UPI002DFC6649|nr:O-antigen/teichoic acid export membrane protein [Chryseobacterium nepalense]
MKLFNSKSLYFYIGSGLAQVVTIITTFYIIKKFTPEAFGEFSYYFSIGSIIGSFATLKYELSIPLSQNSVEANDKSNLTILVSLAFNLIFSLIGLSTSLYQFNIYFLYILLLSNTVSINACFQQFLLYKEEHFLNGLTPLLFSILNLGILLFLTQNNGEVILSSYITSNIIMLIIYLICVKRNGYDILFKNISFYKQLFRKHLDFPRYVLPSSIANILLAYCNPIFIGYLFDKNNVGLFSFSLRILMLPSIVIGSVASSIYRTKIAKQYFDNDIEGIRYQTNNLFLILILLAIFCFPILILVIKYIPLVIDMSRWKGVVPVAVFLVPFAISQLFFQPFSNIALVFKKNKILLLQNVIQLVATVLVYIISFLCKFEFEVFLMFFSATLLIVSFYSCYRFHKILKQ